MLTYEDGIRFKIVIGGYRLHKYLPTGARFSSQRSGCRVGAASHAASPRARELSPGFPHRTWVGFLCFMFLQSGLASEAS